MVTINLSKKDIKDATVLCGFQGTWVVGPIAIQYLLDHLPFENIGEVWFDGLLPFAFIFKEELIKPLSIFYNKKYNLVVLRSTTPSRGNEWQLAEVVENLAKQVKAKEVVVLDGVETNQTNDIFYLTNQKLSTKLKKTGAAQLNNAAVVGVHSVFLIKDSLPVFCLYGTLKHVATDDEGKQLMQVSDGRTAANMITFLDQYLGMNVNVTDLLKKSEIIESKIKELSKQLRQPDAPQQQVTPSYIG